MAAPFDVGVSAVGGEDLLGGIAEMNTGFDAFFPSGEVFPYVATVTTTGFDYFFASGAVYPAMYTYTVPDVPVDVPAQRVGVSRNVRHRSFVGKEIVRIARA